MPAIQQGAASNAAHLATVQASWALTQQVGATLAGLMPTLTQALAPTQTQPAQIEGDTPPPPTLTSAGNHPVADDSIRPPSTPDGLRLLSNVDIYIFHDALEGNT